MSISALGRDVLMRIQAGRILYTEAIAENIDAAYQASNAASALLHLRRVRDDLNDLVRRNEAAIEQMERDLYYEQQNGEFLRALDAAAAPRPKLTVVGK